MNYTDQELTEAIERIDSGFMSSDVEFLTKSEAKEYTDDTLAMAGYYCRLSAPGYMDCTEWSGPYATEREAYEALCEMYDDGEDF